MHKIYVKAVFAYRVYIYICRCICVGMGTAPDVLGGGVECVGLCICVLSGYACQYVRGSWRLLCAQLCWQEFANKGLTQPEVCVIAA